MKRPLALRSPKQRRSQASFERVLDAAAGLLAEHGHEGFTLQEVSRRSGVSIGSIYCRVDGKKSLLRAVDQRLLARFNAEHTEVVSVARSRGSKLADVLPALVHELGEFLKRNAPFLRALIALSKADPWVGTEGKKSYADLTSKVFALLKEHRQEIRHPEPDHAVEFCFEILYGALGRTLGIGTISVPADRNLDRLIEDLSILCGGFLLSDWERLPGREDRFRIESAITWNVRQQTSPSTQG